MTTILLGMPLRPGDEIVTTTAEHQPFYGTLLDRVARDGVVLRRVALPMPSRSTDEVVAALVGAFTPRSRLLLIKHIMLTGRIMPIEEIVLEAPTARHPRAG